MQGIAFSVKAEIKDVMRSLTKAQRKIVPESIAPALNRALPMVRTATVREVSKTMRVPQKILKKRFRFQRRDKATRRRWIAGVWAYIADLPAHQAGMKVRQTRNGVRVGKHSFPGAFIGPEPKQHIASGGVGGHPHHPGTAVKRGHVYRRVGRKRYPVKEMYVMGRFAEMILRKNIDKIGIPAFSKRLDHEIQRRLKREGLL